MEQAFNQYISRARQQAEALISSPAYRIADGLPRDIPEKGVYLFTRGKRHLYTGRSDNIRQRMALHSRPSSSQNQATFAFKLTRERLGIKSPAYKMKGSRSDLLEDRTFREAFQQAKRDIRQMNVRFIAEPGPVAQALLEIYVSVVLRTPFNDFRTT